MEPTFIQGNKARLVNQLQSRALCVCTKIEDKKKSLYAAPSRPNQSTAMTISQLIQSNHGGKLMFGPVASQNPLQNPSQPIKNRFL
jgi:hypothetical protein